MLNFSLEISIELKIIRSLKNANCNYIFIRKTYKRKKGKDDCNMIIPKILPHNPQNRLLQFIAETAPSLDNSCQHLTICSSHLFLKKSFISIVSPPQFIDNSV